jgi:hypothetical protein
MAGGQKNSDYSPNATIITTGGGSGAPRPRNIINAISEIQQFYVIESQGQEIPGEFLTLEGSLDFFRIGATSGFKEGLFVVLLFPIFSFYLLPFVLNSPDLFMKFIINSVPYLPVFVNTLLCSYISRYYVGNITRKAINSLFVGRAILLITKSFLIYVFYYILSELSTPDRVWSVAQHFGSNAEKFYYGYLELLPRIVPVAIHCSIFILISAIFPYGSVYFLDLWRRFKITKNQRIIGKT